ncbi:hypothetical protein [Streptomyces sp. NPDC050982]|uniref:hypothetical protein n=1 Tax=Streptomyces sp. NPDC050982 TaxID=3154746 RepID=UPI0034093E7E
MRRLARRGATAAGQALDCAGLRTGTVGRRPAGHRSWATGITIRAGALALVLWNHPTVGAVALVLAVVLVVTALVAVLAAASATAPATDEPGRAVP